jgi:hypothetical protein
MVKILQVEDAEVRRASTFTGNEASGGMTGAMRGNQEGSGQRFFEEEYDGTGVKGSPIVSDVARRRVAIDRFTEARDASSAKRATRENERIRREFGGGHEGRLRPGTGWMI